MRKKHRPTKCGNTKGWERGGRGSHEREEKMGQFAAASEDGVGFARVAVRKEEDNAHLRPILGQSI